MTSDYQAVQKALGGGADPAMLCATCPWDRNCITPPSMTSAEIEQHMAEASRQDQEKADARAAMGLQPEMPAGVLLTAVLYAGKDLSAQVCPVFSLRLRSGGGRKIADAFKAQMQDWDDQK